MRSPSSPRGPTTCEPSARLGSGMPPGDYQLTPAQPLRTGPWGCTPALLQYCPSLSLSLPLLHLISSCPFPIFLPFGSVSGLGWLFPPDPHWLPCPERCSQGVPGLTQGASPGLALEGFKSLVLWVLVKLGEYCQPITPIPYCFWFEPWARAVVLVDILIII